MKCYETVWEIFNKCANNQMRDVFIDEIETDDIEVFLKNKFKDKEITFEKTVLENGTIVYDIDASGIRQRYSFTEIQIFLVRKEKVQYYSYNKITY